MNNNIKYYWLIGKFIYDNKYKCENIIKKVSVYLSYYFGNSFLFSIENVLLMKRLYLSFPVYHESINKIEWDSYKQLLLIKNKNEMFFYFQVLLFFNYKTSDLTSLLQNEVYSKI